MANLNSWEDDPAAQDDNLARQTEQQMNLGNNPQAGTFRPGAASFTPGAPSFQPGQAYGGGGYAPQYQQQQYYNQGYGYSQYGSQQAGYNQYGQGGYGAVYGQHQGGYNQSYGVLNSRNNHVCARDVTDRFSRQASMATSSKASLVVCSSNSSKRTLSNKHRSRPRRLLSGRRMHLRRPPARRSQ